MIRYLDLGAHRPLCKVPTDQVGGEFRAVPIGTAKSALRAEAFDDGPDRVNRPTSLTWNRKVVIT